MTKLVLLTPRERRRFDSPPVWNTNERAHYFTFNDDEKKIIHELRTTVTKIGFAIQLAYFKSNGKFYSTDQFRPHDIEHAAKILDITDHADLSDYQKTMPSKHRKRILSLLNWSAFNESEQDKIKYC